MSLHTYIDDYSVVQISKLLEHDQGHQATESLPSQVRLV